MTTPHAPPSDTHPRRHHVCNRCGWETLTPTAVRIVFHPCRPKRQRRVLDLPSIWSTDQDVEAQRDVDRALWFLNQWPKPAPPKEK